MTRLDACPACERLVNRFVNGPRCPGCRRETLDPDATEPAHDWPLT
ncbi:MAG: hypothetical protein A07HB70_02299 [uncultured archaeon A07HB70]|jgi:hypothetical protein|nr:MAG: hypothetical protein A07HB70_02299 [uncultured archaeon A07HB70]